MPVLKIKIDGMWLDVDGASGHTHDVNDIINLPTSLPANGGDADTVDGKHASEFAVTSDVEDLKSKVGDTSVSEQITAALDKIGSMTVNISGGGPGGYSADKTFQEMFAEMRAQRGILANFGGRLFTATAYDPGGIRFQELVINGYGRAGEFTCKSTDVWTYTAVEVSGGADDDHINELIDAKLATFTNVAEVGA